MPPSNVFIAAASKQQVSFNFDAPDSYETCSSWSYGIKSENCGMCPNIITSNSFVCNIFPDDFVQVQHCSITITSLLCGHLHGTTNKSASFFVQGWQNNINVRCHITS